MFSFYNWKIFFSFSFWNLVINLQKFKLWIDNDDDDKDHNNEDRQDDYRDDDRAQKENNILHFKHLLKNKIQFNNRQRSSLLYSFLILCRKFIIINGFVNDLRWIFYINVYQTKVFMLYYNRLVNNIFIGEQEERKSKWETE